MLDQFGLDVGPGYVGGGGKTIQSMSLANGGTGGGGWSDPGVQAQYAQAQADLSAVRAWMAASGQPYLVTGTGSMANAASGDATAYLPSMMESYGIKPTAGILNSYRELVGSPYKQGQVITGYDSRADKYSVGMGSGAGGAELMAQYMGGPAVSGQPSQGDQPSQIGGLGQVALGSQKVIPLPVAQSLSTPATAPTTNTVSDEAIQNWFNQNPSWTPESLKTYMVSYGVSPEQVARVTGNRPEVMVERYNRVGRQPVQKGAQTAYVDYTQPLAPVSEGAGSGNAPYYYQTPEGQVASYLPSSYWRGNVPAYGGMYPFARGGEVKSVSANEWLKAKCNG